MSINDSYNEEAIVEAMLASVVGKPLVTMPFTH